MRPLAQHRDHKVARKSQALSKSADWIDSPLKGRAKSRCEHAANQIKLETKLASFDPDHRSLEAGYSNEKVWLGKA